MEFKSQIATTREQSYKLLTLGLKPETADMSIPIKDNPNLYCSARPYNDWNGYWKHNRFVIPAWSLSRLLEMMPLFFRKVIHIQIIPPVVSYWNAGLREFARVYDSSDIYENIISMIAWLISNGYFNTEYLKGETK